MLLKATRSWSHRVRLGSRQIRPERGAEYPEALPRGSKERHSAEP